MTPSHAPSPHPIFFKHSVRQAGSTAGAGAAKEADSIAEVTRAMSFMLPASGKRDGIWGVPGFKVAVGLWYLRFSFEVASGYPDEGAGLDDS